MASRSANSSGRIRSGNGYTAARTSVTRLARLAFGALFQASYTSGAPIGVVAAIEKEAPKMPLGTVVIYVTLGISLVLLGGVFAGLTIALMGQDEIYLQVIATSDDGEEQRHAQKVSRLLAKGKHWVLVTLLLANVIVNESLPIVLDRCIGGGWMAVVCSTGAIVVFGEVIPQSICVRHGLYIGARFSPFVAGLMWILAPVGWPIAKLLDRILGSQHGTVYKKTGLKTLITLHKTLGSATERLNQDEVTIISAVLDLKDKSVGDIMTPMGDVFTMSADTVLDEDTTDLILKAGYSRIPIHEPGNTDNFVGMLLVKILITYDPEDCKKVSEFALATLPETRPETSCLDIVNFFQEGKSHMVLVSESPGENTGAIGVVTLEDVIEELIGEEIIDESDVYIDVHKAIRRMAPAPTSRLRKSHTTDIIEAKESEQPLIDLAEEELINKPRVNGSSRSDSPAVFGTSPKTTFTRRSSSGAGNSVVQIRGNAHDMREHLKHLGPSNLASRPKTTRFQTVKIKPGYKSDLGSESLIVKEPYRDDPSPQGGEGTGLLKNAGKDASDGVQALMQGYGSMDRKLTSSSSKHLSQQQSTLDGALEEDGTINSQKQQDFTAIGGQSNASSDTLGSLRSQNGTPARRKKGDARSGSITENIVEVGGIRKVVLKTNSSSEDDKEEEAKQTKPDTSPKSSLYFFGNRSEPQNVAQDEEASPGGEETKKKRRRTRKKKPGKPSDAPAAGGSAAGDQEQ